eukprot:TRINITY_DN543_c0_g1_i1.p1 TRINITY_DN543_c0_g1~~TRINITY_DN543_c0_g1_i1.p1  ORF type:complete len:140 (+),score=14.93 TRINITY_DN543_c0_g1_i1:277-696(+)
MFYLFAISLHSGKLWFGCFSVSWTKVKEKAKLNPNAKAFAMINPHNGSVTAETGVIEILSRSDFTIVVRRRSISARLDLALCSPQGSEYEIPESAKAISATLVICQEQGGTAVCVSASGLLLTCAHCVADDPSQQLSYT